MRTGNENILTAVDIGEQNTVVLVTERSAPRLRYRGHGIADSRSFCHGEIVNRERSAGSLQQAIEGAEFSAQVPLQTAVVGVAGPQVHGLNFRGTKLANPVPLPKDRQLLHRFRR